MSARLDITVPIRPMTSREERPTRDAALEAAQDAARLIKEAAELLYVTDRGVPTVLSREACIAVRRARNAVDRMMLDYGREASRERLTPR